MIVRGDFLGPPHSTHKTTLIIKGAKIPELSRISTEFLIDQNRVLPFLSKQVSQYVITWFLIAVRQEGNSVVVVHELE